MLIQNAKKVKHSVFFEYGFDKFMKMIYNIFKQFCRRIDGKV